MRVGAAPRSRCSRLTLLSHAPSPTPSVAPPCTRSVGEGEGGGGDPAAVSAAESAFADLMRDGAGLELERVAGDGWVARARGGAARGGAVAETRLLALLAIAATACFAPWRARCTAPPRTTTALDRSCVTTCTGARHERGQGVRATRSHHPPHSLPASALTLAPTSPATSTCTWQTSAATAAGATTWSCWRQRSCTTGPWRCTPPRRAPRSRSTSCTPRAPTPRTSRCACVRVRA